jgi:energy-coupling factor transporter transmembrane protein EcfT
MLKIMLKINVITQLLLFFILAILVNQTHLHVLMYIAAMLALALIAIKNKQFLRAIKRLKWFFLVLIIIFAFNTPGEHMMLPALLISPTYEGLIAGCTQALRIVVMLASLSLVLACNTRQQLISGFYFICSPLKYLGLEVERFAARLWLTLHYVETQQTDNKQGFLENLKNMSFAATNETTYDDIDISFALPEFSLLDFTSIALLAALLLGLAMKAYV